MMGKKYLGDRSRLSIMPYIFFTEPLFYFSMIIPTPGGSGGSKIERTEYDILNSTKHAPATPRAYKNGLSPLPFYRLEYYEESCYL